jgi:hypothetical protein
MSNKKQTAVNYLIDELCKLGYLHKKEYGQSPRVNKVITQAKAIEKEQIENAWLDGHGTESDNEGFSARICINEYIQQTYGE